MTLNLEQITSKDELISLLQIDDIFIPILGLSDLEQLRQAVTCAGWFKAFDNEALVGLFYVKHFAGAVFMFHAGVYKNYRHKQSPQYLKDCLNHLKTINPTAVFITTVNSKNKPALIACERAGFVNQIKIKDGSFSDDLYILTE